MNYGFVIDNRKCIGCHACTVACKSEHNVPIGVNRTHVKYVEKGVFPNTRRTFTVTRCNHCEDAPCVEICPTSALFTRRDGIVDFDSQRCIACKSCMQACPYDALYIDPSTQTAAKCNYCAHRVENGYEPSCVVVCPVEAIISGDLDNPSTKIAQLVAREEVTVRKPEKGTLPNVFYIDGDHAALNPEAALPEGAYVTTDQFSGVGHFASYLQERMQSNESGLFDPSGEPADATPPGGVTLAGAISISQRAVDDVGRELAGRRVYDAPSKGILWGWQVPAYIWTKAIATGTFMVWALMGLLSTPATPLETSIALLTSLGFLLLTSALLVHDLDRPERFLYVLLRPNWSSWLVRGAYTITAFGGVLGILLVNRWFGWGFPEKMLQILGFPLALLGACYTAFLFAQAKGRDLWQSPISAPRMLNHALLSGCSIFLVVRGPEPMLLRGTILLALLNLSILAFELYTPHSSRAAAEAIRLMLRGADRFLLAGGIGLSIAGPLLLMVPAAAACQVAALFILGGIYLTEAVWVKTPQLVPLS